MSKMKPMKAFEKKLSKLRSKIDSADRKLLQILSSRFKVVTKIASLKKKQKAPTRQNSRWEKVLKDRVKRGRKHQIDSKFTSELFNLIHEESIRFQNMLNKNKPSKKEKK